MMFGSFRDLAFMGAALKAAPPMPGLDPDAAAYIAAVEAADGQALEAAVADAINNFVLGCKNDGIWNAIKASCILAGARTLNGALVPLAGTAPTNFNFVAGDYDRKTGLVGDGSTKYLDSNRNNNADPQDSQHLVVFAPTLQSLPSASTAVIGAGAASDGTSQVQPIATGYAFRSRTSAFAGITTGLGWSLLLGVSRNNAQSYSIRLNGSIIQEQESSQDPFNGNVLVYARGGTNQQPGLYSANRLAFYSIGEALDLALLDARVTDLINAFGAAIP